ncbi:hypothetical protein Tco_1246713 [Tanacetum coccineum]
MSTNSDDHSSSRFFDTRPPKLDRTDYESYVTTNPIVTNGHVTYEDLSDTGRNDTDADVRATNIAAPSRTSRKISTSYHHNIKAKAIWDNVKMLLAGSELTKEDRESQLYDEFERFKMLPGENINEYYVRFHKLVNDMRNIRMTMPNIQLNSKFVNNMSPEWDRFVTAVKLNKGLKETNHEQLYAYLKQHEKHAAQDRLIIERITPATNDQLAFVSTVQPHAQSSHVQSHQYPSSSTKPQSRTVLSQSVHKILNYFEGPDASLDAKPKNGAVLDEDELLFLAGEQGNTFDADVDNQRNVDDEPTAQSIFMANLSTRSSSANPPAGQTDNFHNKVQHVICCLERTTSFHIDNGNVIPYVTYLSSNDVTPRKWGRKRIRGSGACLLEEQ